VDSSCTADEVVELRTDEKDGVAANRTTGDRTSLDALPMSTTNDAVDGSRPFHADLAKPETIFSQSRASSELRAGTRE
jgi:hypothetical protein